DGAVRIESDGRTREAEPFATIFSGDRVVVDKGTAAVCDVRTGEVFQVPAGKPFSLPQAVARRNERVPDRLIAAVGRVTGEPEELGVAVVRRFGVVEPWPNDVAFAPGARVAFRWIGHAEPARFSLYRLTPDLELMYRGDAPSPRMSWPAGIVPRAG